MFSRFHRAATYSGVLSQEHLHFLNIALLNCCADRLGKILDVIVLPKHTHPASPRIVDEDGEAGEDEEWAENASHEVVPLRRLALLLVRPFVGPPYPAQRPAFDCNGATYPCGVLYFVVTSPPPFLT